MHAKSRHSAFSVIVISAIALALSSSCVSKTKQSSEISPKNNSDLTLTAADDRSQRVRNVSYQLEVDLMSATSDELEAQYTGKQTIGFDLKSVDRDLRIDFFEGSVSSIAANGQTVPNTVKQPYFIIIPATALRLGRNTIDISYAQKYSRTGQGLHRFRDPVDGNVYLYTQFETYEANRFMPCFDQPDLRSTLTMKVHAPTSWTVVTATRETSSVRGPRPDSRIWSFPTTASLPTYLFSLHAGPYASFSDNSTAVPLRLFVRQSMKTLVRPKDWFAFSKQGIRFYENFFSQKYPFGKLDQLIVPEFNAGGMENAGAITYSEWTLPRSEPTRRMRRNLAGLVLHEIAHMWFGDLVTMAWWNDLWLNESFATYMSSLAMAEATEFKEGWQAFASGVKSGAYAQDAMSTTHPIEAKIESVKQAESNFDGITYNKGASVIKQLAFYVTHDSFRRGLRDYFKKHRFGNTKLTDFVAAIQGHTKKDLSVWADRWLRQSGTDRISTEWMCDGDRLHSIQVNLETLSGRQFRPQSLEIGLYRLSGGRVALSDKVRIDFENDGPAEIAGKWKCPDFVYANHNDHGYINTVLDRRSVEFVTRHISKISDATTRAMIWNDLWRMVRETELPLKSYVSVLRSGLSSEKNDLILQQVVGTLAGRGVGSVLNYWPSNERSQTELFNFVSEMENEFISRIGRSRSGSDEEKFWYDSLTKIARTKPTLNHLFELYENGKVSAAFPLDIDRKWEIAALLSRFQHPQADAVLTAMQAADKTDRGVRAALSVQAIRPDYDRKKMWIQEFQSLESKRPLHEIQAVMWALFPLEQSKLRLRFDSTFYEFFAKYRNTEEQYRAGTFISGLLPLVCEKEPAQRLKHALNRYDDANPALKKNLLMSLDEDERCQRVRSHAGF